MRQFTSKLLTTAFALILVATLSAISLEAARSSSDVAKVIYIDGKAGQSTKKEGPYTAIKKGSSIKQGRYVKAEAGSRATLKLPDGSKVRVGPNSIVFLKKSYFNKKDKSRNVQLEVAQGMVYTKANKSQNKKDTFTVRSKGAVAGIRGTAFDVIQMPQGDTWVNCFQGEVWVGNYTQWLKYNLKNQEGYKEGSVEPKEIPGPREVSQEEWVKTFGEDFCVRVSADGEVDDPTQIQDQPQTDEVKDWEDWNQEQDDKGL